MHFPCLTLLAKKSITKAWIIFALWTAESILPEFYLSVVSRILKMDYRQPTAATHFRSHYTLAQEGILLIMKQLSVEVFAGYFKLTKMCRWQFSPKAEIRAVKSYEFLL